ncbi:MAG: UDP-N-acetylmuramate dehydrogenase, partial [Clostridia bacterium]|nr:UDP-N-acetylmuramate dehydrogenase [Clostridia bacterium]
MSSTSRVYGKLSKICETAKNVNLSKFTSNKIGGVAKFMVSPNSLEQIIKVLDVIGKAQIPYMVLGNMTNVLIDDYDGVVIRIASNFDDVKVHGGKIIASAGCSLSKVCSIAMMHSLSGLEELFGIPGTVGGAVVMNAGAFGSSMENVTSSVIAISDGKITHYTHKECEFGYRHSIFDNKFVLFVQFDLKRGDKNQIQTKMTKYMADRKNSQPLDLPSSGCTFKNIDGLPIGKILDLDGFKGYSVGGASVSTKHANFIVNKDNATVFDVMQLIQKLQNHILQKYNVMPQTEIKIIRRK